MEERERLLFELWDEFQTLLPESRGFARRTAVNSYMVESALEFTNQNWYKWKGRPPQFAAAECWRAVSTRNDLDENERFCHVLQILRRLDEIATIQGTTIPVFHDSRMMRIGVQWWPMNHHMPDTYLNTSDGGRPAENRFMSIQVFDDFERNVVPSADQLSATIRNPENSSVRVGLCPLSGLASPVPMRTRRLNETEIGFVVTAMHPQDAYHSELEAHLAWAKEKGIHVLCFPELTVCPTGIDTIKTTLKTFDGEAKPMLVFPGSFHYQGNSNYQAFQNKGGVWESPFEAPIKYYQKSEPFSIPPSMIPPSMLEEVQSDAYRLVEDIEEEIHFTHLDTPIGYIGIIICKDGIFPPSRIDPRRLALNDHLFILSMNFSETAGFKKLASQMTKFGNTAVYFVNAGCAKTFVNNPANYPKIELALSHFPVRSNPGFQADPNTEIEAPNESDWHIQYHKELKTFADLHDTPSIDWEVIESNSLIVEIPILRRDRHDIR